MNFYKSGESFIDYIYRELINSDEVKKAIQRRDTNPKNREEAVRYYMERMENAHNTKRKNDILKRFYYKKYVIDYLPKSYVERQLRIAREQGKGNIRITNEMQNRMLEEIQSEQKKSIDNWLDYLNSGDVFYPMWFKYYVFQGMIKLGKYDKAKKKFRKRTKNTTNPFIEVNPEILGQMYTILKKMIEKQVLTEEESKSLEKGESFQKLYTSLLIQTEENRITNGTGTEGKWIKYEQGDNYQELWKSLQGKNTGWCTTGEEMCRSQIKEGDFYVYYTYDKDGNLIEPRIAIRMDGNYEIAEVRGIGKNQNLEPEMLEIAEAKLEEFPDYEGARYQKKVHDMHLLTEIERKTNNNEELTQKDIVFLYELEAEIDGFGWERDPRISEIIRQRDINIDIEKLDREKIKNGIYDFSRLLEQPLRGISLSKYKEFALMIIKQNCKMIEHLPFISLEVTVEKIISELLKDGYYSFIHNYIPDDFHFKNPEIALETVKHSYDALNYISTDLPNYKEISLEVKKRYQNEILSYQMAIAELEKLIVRPAESGNEKESARKSKKSNV